MGAFLRVEGQGPVKVLESPATLARDRQIPSLGAL